MDIKFLGTGGAFDVDFSNSAAVIELNGKVILLDCGYTTYSDMRQKDILPSVQYVLITHLHDDHVGSLSTLIFHHHFFIPEWQLILIYPTEEFRQQLTDLLDHSLINTEEYLKFVHIDEFEDIGYIDTADKHIEGMPSFGYYFTQENELMAYSGDVADPNVIFNALEPLRADKDILVFHEIGFYNIPVHVHYKDVEKHLDDYEIYGYHCDPSKRPDDLRIPLVFDHPEFLF